MEIYNVAGVDALSYTLSSLIILAWRTWSWSHGRYVTVSSRDIHTVAASLDHRRSQWMVPLRVVSKIEAQSELHVTSSLHLHLHLHTHTCANNPTICTHEACEIVLFPNLPQGAAPVLGLWGHGLTLPILSWNRQGLVRLRNFASQGSRIIVIIYYTHIHTYIHTYIHIYIYTYKHIYI